MNPDDGGYGYDDRPDRRRQKKSNTSTILLVVAGVLVLVGAILIGKWAFSGKDAGNDSFKAPNFVSQTYDEATKMAENRDLKLVRTNKTCEDEPKGSVCTQDPTPGTLVKKGDTINLVVSTGAPKVVVPNVTGKTLDEATSILGADKYQFRIKTKYEESTETENLVLKQNPELGAEVQKGSTITLTVAKKKQQVPVPDVIGKTCDQATAQMAASNLVASCTEVETDDANLVGKVIQTSPVANAQADPGSTVTIQIGKAKAQVAVPTVAGGSLKDAKKAIEAAGLTVGNISGSQDDNAIVISTDPQAGTPVNPGTAINLTAAGGNGNNNGGTNIFGGTTG